METAELRADGTAVPKRKRDPGTPVSRSCGLVYDQPWKRPQRAGYFHMKACPGNADSSTWNRDGTEPGPVPVPTLHPEGTRISSIL